MIRAVREFPRLIGITVSAGCWVSFLNPTYVSQRSSIPLLSRAEGDDHYPSKTWLSLRAADSAIAGQRPRVVVVVSKSAVLVDRPFVLNR